MLQQLIRRVLLCEQVIIVRCSMGVLGEPALIRASIAMYNSKYDIDHLVMG